MNSRVIVLALLVASLFSAIDANANYYTTLILHAVEEPSGPCFVTDPCPYAVTTTVRPGVTVTVHLIARHYWDLIAIQTAFDWDDWTLLGSQWDCQSVQVTTYVPSGPGPDAGTLTTAFDAITGGASTPIGRLFMIAGSGAFRQVDSIYPEGTHVVGSGFEIHPIAPGDRGLLRVAAPGIDVCDERLCGPEPTPACDGTVFTQVDVHYLGTRGVGPAIGDVNVDGLPDVVAAIDDYVATLPGIGSGTFADPIFTATGYAAALALGRLDGDDLADLAVMVDDSLVIHLGRGDGTFDLHATYPLGGWVVKLLLHDLDGDQHLDVIALDRGGDVVVVLLGNGDGTFDPSASYATVQGGLRGAALGDVTGDQIADIVVVGSDQGDGRIEILVGMGDGTFTLGGWSATIHGPLGGIALGDLDGDQILDLAVAGAYSDLDSWVDVFLGDGDGTFDWHHMEDSRICQRDLAIVDLDEDPHSDLAILTGGNCTSHALCIDGRLTVLSGQGDGTFVAGSDCLLSEEGAGGLAVGDVTGDLRTDLVVGLYGRVGVLHGTSTTGTPPVGAPPPATSVRSAPNPFYHSTTIAFANLTGSEAVASLRVYDAQGRLVRTLLDAVSVAAGERRVAWDGRDDLGRRVAAGTYFSSLRLGAEVIEHKLHLIR
jgi:hypothetical protein